MVRVAALDGFDLRGCGMSAAEYDVMMDQLIRVHQSINQSMPLLILTYLIVRDAEGVEGSEGGVSSLLDDVHMEDKRVCIQGEAAPT